VGLRLPPSGFTDRTASRGGVAYASWLRRAGGLVIDLLLLYMITTLFFIVLGAFTPALHVHLLAAIILFVVLGGISVLYATLCLTKLHGQTPGMRAVQIRCVPAAGRGSLSTAQALTRSVTAAVIITVPRVFGPPALVLLGVYLAAYLWPLIVQRRQTWWDLAAATVVLDDRGY